MTIFQQAKDMKLDPALMFVSVAAVMTLWYGVRDLIKPSHAEQRLGYALIGIAGVLVGIAFGIKFTTLMLIIASIVFMSYRLLGI